MSIFKRGKKYWIYIGHNGQRIRKCCPESSAAGAKAYEALLRQKLARGESLEPQASAPDKTISIKEFSVVWMRDYASANNKSSSIRSKTSILDAHLIPYFGELRIDKITNHEIEKYKALKQREGKANKSINNQLSVLRKMLTTAEDWELLDKVPRIKPLKVMPCKTDFLTLAECGALIANADGVWKDMILFAIKTGLRISELIGLTWVDVDFASEQITVQRSIVKDIPQESTKSNRIRHVPLIPEAMKVLLKRKSEASGDYIFSRQNSHDFLKIEYCRKNIQRIAKACGLRSIGWHLLRHSYASHLSEKGISPIVIKELLGHSDIKTTMRYAHLGSSTMKEAVKVLESAPDLATRHNNATSAEIVMEYSKIPVAVCG